MDHAAWANASSERATSRSILSGCRLSPRSMRSFCDLALFDDCATTEIPFCRCQRIATHPPSLNRNFLFHFKNAGDHTRAPHRHDYGETPSPEVVRFEYREDAAYS